MRPHLDALNEIADCIYLFDKEAFNVLLDIVLHNDKLIQDFHHKLLTSDYLFKRANKDTAPDEQVSDSKVMIAEELEDSDHQ